MTAEEQIAEIKKVFEDRGKYLDELLHKRPFLIGITEQEQFLFLVSPLNRIMDILYPP